MRPFYGACRPLALTVAIPLYVGVFRLKWADIYEYLIVIGPPSPLHMHVTPLHSNIPRLDDIARDLSKALGRVNVSSRVWPMIHDHLVIPIILRDGELFATNHVIGKLETDKKFPGYGRALAVVEMIRTGLDLVQSDRLPLKLNSDLPVLLMTSDESGCGIEDKFDEFGYPRVAWYVPSSAKYGQDWDWCETIGVPTYETWKSFKKYESASSWDMQLQNQAKQYPWSSKINKAVWRGGTTSDPIYKQTNSFLTKLEEIPRGKLVQKSILHPSLIDAAFTKFNQEYKGREQELNHTTILKEIMPFNDQMKFKAIIDIDGNTWSSRFPKLLCTNSVVIKVCVYIYISFLCVSTLMNDLSSLTFWYASLD